MVRTPTAATLETADPEIVPNSAEPISAAINDNGLVAAAVISGWTAERSRHWLTTALGLLAAIVAIHLLGAAWLATLVGPAKAVSLGVLPFLLGDAVKLALVTAAAEAGLARPRA